MRGSGVRILFAAPALLPRMSKAVRKMDETAVSVRGGAQYLYRAVDKHGKTVDSLLCADRSESDARAFFSQALKTNQYQRPRKINLDGNAATHRALRCYGKRIPCGGPWSCAAADTSTTSWNRTIERLSAAALRCWP